MYDKKQAKQQVTSGLQSFGRKRDTDISEHVSTGKSGSSLCRTGPHPSGATNLVGDFSEILASLADQSDSVSSCCVNLSILIRHISQVSSWFENLFLKLNYPRDLRLENTHRLRSLNFDLP